MSLVPLLFRDWWEDAERPSASRLLDQHFGLGLRRDDLVPPPRTSSLLRSHYLRPWRLARQNSGTSSLAYENNQFQVSLDVQQFAPSELSVKVTEGCVVVEGCHEERPDEHGYISRQFRRRYQLPEDVDTDAVSSSLSSDGVITITAPSKKQLPAGERSVPITQTGAPALSPAPQAPSSPSPAPFTSPASPASPASTPSPYYQQPAPAPAPSPAHAPAGPVTTNIRIEKE